MGLHTNFLSTVAFLLGLNRNRVWTLLTQFPCLSNSGFIYILALFKNMKSIFVFLSMKLVHIISSLTITDILYRVGYNIYILDC